MVYIPYIHRVIDQTARRLEEKGICKSQKSLSITRNILGMFKDNKPYTKTGRWQYGLCVLAFA
jgi:hypothetical protein